MNNLSSYNPDVLSCIANLSNDEVFTPPEVANAMLDMLPKELFRNPNVTFLDPATKSGVFLREIAKRLIVGLEPLIPDLQERINHIYHNQLFGIAITELTSLLSRRSLYCSKYPNSIYSVSPFENIQGNIRFKNLKHRWKNGKCVYCGTSQDGILGSENRGSVLETHAYELIHTTNPKEILKMKFDVIISNPPYQLSTNGSVQSQATPIYNKFIEQAIKLNPKYLAMITPARWLNGGFGLDTFRNNMLHDSHISIIHDFLDSTECFPGVDISGGICYFLWDRDKEGNCDVYTHRNGKVSFANRPLLENGLNTFIRQNEAISILNKVRAFNEPSFEELVSPRDPFGLNYYENGAEKMFKKMEDKSFDGCVGIYYYGWLKDGIKYTDKKYITTNHSAIDKYKVMISKAYGERGDYPYFIIGKPFIAAPNTCCNMTYLVIGEYDDEQTAQNVASYMRTKFFRYLVSLLKTTQNAYKKVYTFVPQQDFSKSWTDEELYEKYAFTDEEISFIDSMIKPMDLTGDDNG